MYFETLKLQAFKFNRHKNILAYCPKALKIPAPTEFLSVFVYGIREHIIRILLKHCNRGIFVRNLYEISYMNYHFIFSFENDFLTCRENS